MDITIGVDVMPQSPKPNGSHTPTPSSEKARFAEEEKAEPTVSTPGGFANDPDDASNPNEAIERHRRKLRP